MSVTPRHRMCRLIAVLLLGASGCSFGAVNRAALIASAATIACDWGQTRGMAADGWMDHEEQNPLLGRTPTTGAVDGYFFAASVTNVLLSMALPRSLSTSIGVVVTAAQAKTIVANVGNGTGMCGI